MSRIILFSDLHSDEHEDFSYRLPNGMNSRLADCLDVIDKVNRYRREYDCDLVCFGGDMFHTPSVLPTLTFQETFKRLDQLAKDSANMVILAGNHDMASVNKDNPVSTVYATRKLRNTKLAVGGYKKIEYDNLLLHCIPYIKDSKELQNAIGRIKIKKGISNLIVTHIGLDQAVNGPNEIKLKNSYAVSNLKKLGADYVFSGHHHHPQAIGSDHIVIGSPLQMNMLDRGDRRGLVVYDTERKDTTRIWLSGSRFLMYEVKSKKDFDTLKAEQESFKGAYVRVLLSSGIVSETRVIDIVSKTAKMYKIIPVRSAKSVVRNEAVTNKAVANIGNISAVVEDYVQHIKPKGLNRRRLISVGKRLIARSDVPVKGKG